MDEHEQRKIFDQWLGEHRGLSFKVVRACAFNLHDQGDLFQEIAGQFWKLVPKFPGKSKVTTWMYRAALYSALARFRKEQRHRERHETIEGQEHKSLQPAKTRNQRLDWLYEQIGRLAEVYRSLTLFNAGWLRLPGDRLHDGPLQKPSRCETEPHQKEADRTIRPGEQT